MESGTVRACWLLVMVALAGCNGLGGPGSASQPASVTPVALPATDTRTTATGGTAGQLPPGLSTAGIADPAALVRAHVDALDRRSYTLWHARTVVYANGTVAVNRTIEAEFSAGERYRAVVERRGSTALGDGERVVAYSDGQRTSREVSVVRDGEARFLRNRSGIDMRAAPLSVLDFQPDFRTRLRRTFAAAETVSVDVEFSNTLGGGELSYTLAGELAANTSQFPGAWNGTFSATVDPNGVVRFYTLSYTTTRHGHRIRVRERGGYANLAVAGSG